MNRMARGALAVLLLSVLVLGGASSPLAAAPDELTLREAVARALEHSSAIEMAEVRRDRARLESRQAQDAADAIPEAEVDSYQMALLKYFYPRQARSAHRLARREVEATEEDVRLQVELAYRSLQRAETMGRPARAAVRVAAESLRAAERLWEEDMISRAELLRARAGLEEARSLVDRVGAAREEAERALRIVLDYDPRAGIDIGTRRPRFAPLGDVNLEEKVEMARGERFAMRELTEMRELAEYRLDLARRYPSEPADWPIDLPPDLFPDLGVGGGTDDEYAAEIAELDAREAALAKKMLGRQIESEVRSLHREIRSVEQRVSEREAATAAAVEEYRRTAAERAENMATRQQLLAAYAGRMRAEAEYLEAVYAHEIAVARFHHSYGPGGAMQGPDEGGHDRGDF